MIQLLNENGIQHACKLVSSRYGTIPTSLRNWLLFAVIAVCTYLLYVISSCVNTLLLTNTDWDSRHNFILQTESDYAIKTKGCTIPALNPFDESIIPFAANQKKNKPCSKNNQTILQQNNTHIWIDKSSLASYNIKRKTLFCCYQSFYRPNSVKNIKAFRIDDRVVFSKCVYFFDAIQASDEFVKITCNIGQKKVIVQYFLFAIKKHATSSQNNPYNVLVLGIDGVSRLNFYRTMPKTLKFLKDKGAVELFGYNKVADNTFPNLVPMLMGITESELKRTCFPNINSTFDNCPLLWNGYKGAGFYTAFGEDSGWLGTFNYRLRGFIDSPTDYYVHTFMRDAERNVGKNKDVNTYLCMSDRYFYKVLLDYIERLSQIVTDPKLFGFFWEITMTHDFLTYPMAMDESYENFLSNLHSSGYLDQTIIFLVSDHGIRWGKIRFTKQGRLEERLPFVYILTPQSFRDEYSNAYENLKINRRRLTTPFDIYATLYDLINIKNINNTAIDERSLQQYAGKRGISLFLKVPENRTCSIAGIEEHWCTCHRGVRMAVESGTAMEAASALVGAINALLSGHAACARLRLAVVLEATELKAGGDGTAAEWREFLLVVRTTPGDAVFEATLRHRAEPARWQLAGSVSRLNLYGTQSHCVHHYLIKLYCYCL